MAIKYLWLADILRTLINKNLETGNNRLPSENQLCHKYKVSRQTIRTTLTLLQQEGLIVKKHGSGSYITGHTKDTEQDVIGILISSNQEYIYPSLLHDIQNTLSQGGFSSRIYTTENQFRIERQILTEILKKPLRCLLVEGCKSALPNPNIDLYQKLRANKTHIIFLHNFYSSFSDSLYVKDNNIQGSALLVKYLFEQGHTQIGGIFCSEDLQGIERFQGFMEAMRDLDLPVLDETIFWFNTQQLSNLQKEHDTDFLKKAVQKAFSSCTAVVCYNDEIAFWLLKELKAFGYHLPHDMAVVAFDNSYLSETSTLSITSLSHKPHEMSNHIAQTALNQLRGLPVQSIELPWRLSMKQSTHKDVE